MLPSITFLDLETTGATPLRDRITEIAYIQPAVKRDASGKVMKPTNLASSFEFPILLFCAQGGKIRIDTRSGEFGNPVLK